MNRTTRIKPLTTAVNKGIVWIKKDSQHLIGSRVCMRGKQGREPRVHKISGSRCWCQGSQHRGLGGLVGTTEIRKYQTLFLTCDHEVLVLLVESRSHVSDQN